MTSPQTENGYTRIANELFEALAKIRINGEARQVLDVIIRKTYGFQKKEDRIALSQFCLATGLIKTHVIRGINKLLSMNIITKKGNDSGVSYGLNKKYSTWKPLPKKVTLPKKVIAVTQKGEALVPKKVHTKETTTKETITKEKKPLPPQATELAGLLAELIFNNNPDNSNLLSTKKYSTIQRWADDIDKINRLDKQSWEKINSVIRWCQADTFWQGNILSGKKLRDQFNQLTIQSNKPQQPTRIEQAAKNIEEAFE